VRAFLKTDYPIGIKLEFDNQVQLLSGQELIGRLPIFGSRPIFF
jgi:hypothetical protein